ncbi:hypothetical protein F4815DRAFT_479396 [Daldinia loculata]|nr:hypothetical protein F4815DRAFT_479396 [Daldinia loculata]
MLLGVPLFFFLIIFLSRSYIGGHRKGRFKLVSPLLCRGIQHFIERKTKGKGLGRYDLETILGLAYALPIGFPYVIYDT